MDEFWSEVSRSVSEGDFDAYAATYHDDAILVSESTSNSYLISQAFERWKPGFADTRAGRSKASVTFRFTSRLVSADTAHETGIFHYKSEDESGKVQEAYIHFEALLINRNGWKMLMEYQQNEATESEWEAAVG